LFFTSSNPNFFLRFIGKSRSEIVAELDEWLFETDLRSSLAILSRLEAAFRIDYEQRCKKKKHDAISMAFRALYRKHRENVRLEEEIFATWRQKHPETAQLISELKGAFKFRHWLTHGTHWVPNLARKYDYQSIYLLADNVFENFQLHDRP
jgi:predicted CopG family antitoxin